MEIIKNIIEKLVINSDDDEAIQDLNELIKDLKPGEGIPISLGAENHAIVFEINRNGDGSYSFATINTGSGAESVESEIDQVYCRKYLKLEPEEVLKAIKEFLNLKRAKGNYSYINDQRIGGGTTEKRNPYSVFNQNIATMFSGKLEAKQGISAQKRGTCGWSSLDCWLQRYCKQRGLGGLYEEFNTFTAEEALSTANEILKSRNISILDTEAQSNLYMSERLSNIKARTDLTESQKEFLKQACIINFGARRILFPSSEILTAVQKLDSVFPNYKRVEALQALAKSTSLDADQFTEILEFATANIEAFNAHDIAALLKALAEGTSLDADQFTEILEFATANSEVFNNSYYIASFLEVLAKSANFTADQRARKDF